jgi:uncharacterized protein YjbI with pentapeptide repeats
MDHNVSSRIDDYLDQVFGAWEDHPSVAELRLEVRHDLLDHLRDLTERGVGDEVAYARVISGLGDIGATIRQLADQDQADLPAQREAAPEQPAAVADPTPVPPPPSPPDEPTGPAEDLPAGDTPGTAWRAGDTDQATTDQATDDDAAAPPDWLSAVSDAVNAGLETARTQIADALGMVEDALIATGWTAGWSAHPTEGEAGADTEAGATPGADTAPGARYRNWSSRRSGISFAATDLRGADFSGQQLPQASFAAAQLRNATFEGAHLPGANLRACDLRGANFTRTDLTGANLSSSSLRGAQWDHTGLARAVLTTCDLRAARFTGASLAGVRARYTDLRQARFADCALDGADFSCADLREANFDGLALRDVNFTMANLTRASFVGSTLRSVNFRHVARRAVAEMRFQDTVVDQTTYLSLRASGHHPTGLRVEN